MNRARKEAAMIKENGSIVVVGGGTAGMIAALAAARNGCRVTVIEKNGFAGGVATFGIPFLAFLDGRGRRVVGGIPQELIDRLVAIDASPGHVGGVHWSLEGQDTQFFLTPYDPEAYKTVILQMAREAGVSFLLHTFFTDVKQNQDGLITHICYVNKSGEDSIPASVVIDATGDADVVRKAGYPYRIGSNTGEMQNASGIFILGGVDAEQAIHAMQSGIAIKGWDHWHTRIVVSDLVEGESGISHFAGIMHPFADDRGYAFTAVSWRKGLYSFNISRTTGINGCRHKDLVRAELSERQNMYEIFQGMKQHVPGFSHSYMVATSPVVGIRESANIIGTYILERDDVIQCREHDDNVARGCYPIDIHDPDGGNTKFAFLKDGASYGIPYRCLVPLQSKNVIVAGRCLSASHEAHGSTRIMATAMATGQAAGTAAAIALANQQPFSSPDFNWAGLRQLLRQQGAILDQRDVVVDEKSP